MSTRQIDRALEWAKKEGMNQSDLARALGVLPQDITNWKKRDLPSDRYLDMAQALKRSVDELLGFEPKRDTSAEANTAPGPRMQGHVPLISWVQAGDWYEAIDNFQPGDAEEWLACPRRHGPHTFALRVRGVSMEPKYRDGAIIYVDPDRTADHLSNVVVRIEGEAEVTFKQLVIEGNKKFLRPLNPDWPGPKLIEIDGHAVICGVV